MTSTLDKAGVGGLPAENLGKKIAAEVIAALEAGQLELPTLPDMAIRIRESLENPEISVEKLVHILSTDPVVTVHIIRAANNSSLYNGSKVDNLRDAVSRLGYRLLYSIVMNVTLAELFQAKDLSIDRALRRLWQHSREVAAHCYVLAKKRDHLNPEVALLTGLVHDIGALPLYLSADRLRLHPDQVTLEGLIQEHAAAISPRLLQSWNFPDSLVSIVSAHKNPRFAISPDLADYVDVLTMANLQMEESTKPVTWRNISAAERLYFYPGDCRIFFSSHAEQIAAVKGMLGINAELPAKATDADETLPLTSHQPFQQSGFINSLSRLFRQQQ